MWYDGDMMTITRERNKAAAALAGLRTRTQKTCALPDCDHEHRVFVGLTYRLYCCHAHTALASWRRKHTVHSEGVL